VKGGGRGDDYLVKPILCADALLRVANLREISDRIHSSAPRGGGGVVGIKKKKKKPKEFAGDAGWNVGKARYYQKRRGEKTFEKRRKKKCDLCGTAPAR